MKNVGVCLLALALIAVVTTSAVGGRSGNSDTWQLQFDDVSGKAHVTAPEIGGEVSIGVNLKGLDPDTEYVVKSQGQIVGGGFPNRGGNLNLQGVITDSQGFGRVNLRLASDNSLVAQTDVYVVDAP